jgi:hypothetical protein
VRNEETFLLTVRNAVKEAIVSEPVMTIVPAIMRKNKFNKSVAKKMTDSRKLSDNAVIKLTIRHPSVLIMITNF